MSFENLIDCSLNLGRVLSDNELKVMENETNTVACCADNNFIGFVTVVVVENEFRSIARRGFRFVLFDI